MNAIVIDDSRAMRTILGNFLKSLGYQVREACNGVEGLQRLNDPIETSLAMVDWNMPEMNGIDFVKATRSKPEYSNMRILMVTTESDLGRMQEALNYGADEYVMKPFTREVLVSKLEILGLASA